MANAITHKDGAPASFNGVFNPALKRLLRQRRQQEGLSLNELGEILDAHASTIRKWESGATCRCHPRYLQPLQKFLFPEKSAEHHPSPPQRPTPKALSTLIRRLSRTYQLCRIIPPLQQELLKSLANTLQKNWQTKPKNGSNRR